MKKSILIAIVSFFAFSSAQAQTEQGTVFVGGNLGLMSSSSKFKIGNTETETNKNLSYNFSPNIGYFVANNTAIGINLGYGGRKDIEYNGITKNTFTSTSVNAGLFAQHYFMLLPQFGLTGSLYADYSFGPLKVENENTVTGAVAKTEYKSSNIAFGLNGGGVWFPSSHIGISAGIGILNYTIYKQEEKNATPEVKLKDSGFNFGLSSTNFNLGFNYYFN